MNAAHVEHRGPPVTIRVSGCVMCESPSPGTRTFSIHANNDIAFRYQLCSACLIPYADLNKDATQALHDTLLAKLWLIREAMERQPSRQVAYH